MPSRRIAIALGAAALGALAALSGGAGAADRPPPGAAAGAWAVRITIPGRIGSSASVARSSSPVGFASRASYSYPKNGSVVVTGATTAKVSTKVSRGAAAGASSAINDLSVFSGEITASVGIAEFSPAMEPEQLIEKADLAMYKAKSHGGNRIVVADP